LTSEVVDWCYHWLTLFWFIVVRGEKISFGMIWAVVDAIMDWQCFGWLLEEVEEGILFGLRWEVVSPCIHWLAELVDWWRGRRKNLHLDWVSSWLMQLLIKIVLVDCCERWEKVFLFGMRQEVVKCIPWLTELVDCWERKDKAFGFKSSSSQLMQYLTDIVILEWLLQEVGERIPLWIKTRCSWLMQIRLSQALMQFVIDKFGWLLWGEEGEILSGLSWVVVNQCIVAWQCFSWLLEEEAKGFPFGLNQEIVNWCYL